MALSEGAEVYWESFSDGFRPDPILTVSEWADANRYLSQRASAEPGRWLTSRTPYLKEVCLLYTSPSPRDRSLSRMPSSA